MKKTDYLIIMHTGTAEGVEITKNDIIEQHTQSRALGGLNFNRPGIDYLIPLDGQFINILPENSPNEVDLWGISDGADGFMGSARFIGLAGGMDKEGVHPKNTLTDKQKETLANVVPFFVYRFPTIQVVGYDQIPAKKEEQNPGFDVTALLKEIGIPDTNIFQ